MASKKRPKSQNPLTGLINTVKQKTTLETLEELSPEDQAMLNYLRTRIQKTKQEVETALAQENLKPNQQRMLEDMADIINGKPYIPE